MGEGGKVGGGKHGRRGKVGGGGKMGGRERCRGKWEEEGRKWEEGKEEEWKGGRSPTSLRVLGAKRVIKNSEHKVLGTHPGSPRK